VQHVKVDGRPKSRVQGIRIGEAELARCKAAAAEAGLSFNAWARLALTDTADLEAALAQREADRERAVR
jgi:hypothetical protein